MRYLYVRVTICLFILLSLSATGQTFQSADRIAGVGYDKLQDVATDASDNFYTVGCHNNKITDPPFSLLHNSSSTINKTFLFKYASDGTLTWPKIIYTTGSGSIQGTRVAVDNAGNVFIAGSLYGSTVYFDGFSAPSSFNGPGVTAPDGFIAKYSSSGAFMWVRAIGSDANNDEILDMALDANGDVYVTGYIAADADVYGRNIGALQARTDVITSQGGTTGLLDVMVAKFANDGTYQWGFTIGSTDGAEKGTALTIDASNNVFVAGQLFGTMDFDPSAATVNLIESTPPGSGDAFIAKYTSAGAFVNVGQISGAGVENINRMHIGASGTLNVAGSFTGFIDADLRSGANIQNLTAAGSGSDILFAKYNLTTFAPVFIQKMGGSNVDDEAIGIKANASGDCYLTGYFSGSAVNFNPGGATLNLTSAGGKDAFISKYNSTGVNSWAFSAGSPTDDQGSAMAFNSLSFIYAGGYYTGTIGDLDPGSGTSTLTNLGLEDSFWSKYQECSSIPVISTQPTPKSVCAGLPVSLSIVATGSGILYQWKKGGVNVTDGGTISGATTATLSISAAAVGDAATYTCVVSSCGTSVTSSNAVVTVNVPPAITSQPVSSSICTGNTSFAVGATGSFLTYQWKLNGTDLTDNAVYAGVHAATLNLVAPTAANQGTYTCVITGTCLPVVTTTGATLTIGSGISITSNPSNKTACLGSTTNFTVAASGSSLSYKWQKNGVDMSDGGSISGALTNTLTITGVVAGDATNYKCVITGTCGTATSTAATLSITSSPVITTQPVASQTICLGQSASFSLVATGAVSYQWKKNGTDLTNTGNVSGALSTALLVSAITASDVGTYTCVVTGSCSPVVTSTNSFLNSNTLPAITTQPVASTICAGGTASFSISATGTAITYQWKKNGVDVVNGPNTFGAQTNSLTITGTVVADGGNYTCVVAGTCSPAVTSTSVALTVNSTASISSNPAPTTVCAGQTTTLTLGTTGSGITYQWKKGGTNLSDGGNISGALTSVLTLINTSAADAGTYSCTIDNSCSGTLNSTTASLTVRALPTITSQPTDVTICGSSTVNFAVTATGTGLIYTWKKGATTLTDGGAISGATTASLSITPAVAADAGAYTCVVSGACVPAVTSTVANLAVGSLATITTQPVNKTVCMGSTAGLSIVVSGTGISYQWQKNGVDLVNNAKISGATSANLSIANIVAADADNYTCKTGNACSGFIVSSAATITVDALPVISTQPSDVSVCAGLPASFTISASGTGISYLWKKNGAALSDGANINGSATTTLTIASTSVADNGTYICEVSGTCSPKAISTGATLSVGATTTIISQPTSKIACTGTSTVFVCSATGGTISYKWQKNGSDLIDGGNISGSSTFTLDIANVTASDAASYVCVVSSACSSSINSNAATLTVNNSTVITAQPVDVTVCSGAAASFSVTATGTSLAYQWKFGGAPVSGATNATYSIASALTSQAGTYTCDITSACSFVSSSSAALVVNAPIAVTTQPSDLSACPGDNITIAVVATGLINSYQWQKDGVDLVDGGNISNATTSILSIDAVSATDVAAYTCIMTAGCGSDVTTSTANLSLSTAPIISAQTGSQLICVGQPLALSITVSNPVGVLYKWKKNGVDVVNGGGISGATSATLTISSVGSADAGDYTCEASTSCSTPTTSAVMKISTTASSGITKQPISANVCKNQSVLFVVNIAGAGITYQWQFKSNSSIIFTDLTNSAKYSGVNTNSLSTFNVGDAEVGNYRCHIIENCGAAQYSAAASITINSPVIFQNPFSQSVCFQQLAKFTVAATGDNLVYQWCKDGVAVTNNARITGAKSSMLMIGSTSSADNGDYTCIVNGICAPADTSLAATLTVSVCTDISVADIGSKPIALFPNPANDKTVISINERIGLTATVMVYNLQGSSVMMFEHAIQSDIEKIDLTTTDLPSGMYFVQIQFGDELYCEKVEVIH